MASKPANARPGSRKTTASPGSDGSVSLTPLKDRRKLDSVMDAVSSAELPRYAAWYDLDRLSTRTSVEDVEAVPEGIFEDGKNGFTAIATVYVDLNYGDKSDGVSSSDSFPAQIQGHFAADGQAVIDAVSVDTSSFDE
jgi:hypothetical protein